MNSAMDETGLCWRCYERDPWCYCDWSSSKLQAYVEALTCIVDDTPDSERSTIAAWHYLAGRAYDGIRGLRLAVAEIGRHLDGWTPPTKTILVLREAKEAIATYEAKHPEAEHAEI